MTAPRVAKLTFALLLLSVSDASRGPLVWNTPAAMAAPKASPQPSGQPLTFDVSARITGNAEDPLPPQVVTARVFVLQDKVRLETGTGADRSIALISPPYIYRLLPESKVGVRWKWNKPAGEGAANPQELLRNPDGIRRLLANTGAKAQGRATLNGVACDYFVAQNFRGRGATLHAWLRRSDALPLRVEMKSPELQITANWSNYKRPKSLPPALFQVPSGYKVRDAKGRAPAFGM